MKYIVIQGDGMADKGLAALGGATPLQAANTPTFDYMAENGRCGLLQTIPEGFPPGSEVGNLSILGYDVHDCFEGRGPLEAASIGYDMKHNDLAMRCNIIAVDDQGNILNHHGDNLTSEEGRELIESLNKELSSDKVRFYPGINYRHLLIINSGEKNLSLFPPHDHVGENTTDLLNKTVEAAKGTPGESTALLIADLVRKSKDILLNHPVNQKRIREGKRPANIIWPWSEGLRPQMTPLSKKYPHIKGGVMITAVDLLRGIGRYAGLKPIFVEGATGLANTNYEGKAKAAIDALEDNDFVFVHVEATDEASHDRNLPLKIKAIEYLDDRIVKPIVKATLEKEEKIRIVLLPDHPTSVETGKHLSDPVPFVIFQKGGKTDEVKNFDEISCAKGSFGTLSPDKFINIFLNDEIL